MDLQNVPEEYKEIYSRHYDTIRTRVFRGRTKYVYHFLMTENYSLSPLDWKVLQSVLLSALYETYRRV